MKIQRPGQALLRLGACVLALSCLSLSSCSDTTAPVEPPASGGEVNFGGDFGSGEFLLERVSIPTPDGRYVDIALVGKNLQLDDTGDQVSLDVAIRNNDVYRALQTVLYPPVLVTLQHFQPAGVSVTNADYPIVDSVLAKVDMPALAGWVFDYSDYVGDDGALTPGETSAFRTWQFHDTGQVPFTFEAKVQYSLEPSSARLSGVVFSDLNRNGQLDDDETGFNSFGWIDVMLPDGGVQRAQPDTAGHWSVPVKEPGLHTVTFVPPPTASILPVCLTTPNPLSVVLTPGPDGSARSYSGANFGIDPRPCILPTVPFVEVVAARPNPKDVPQDPYRLLELGLDANGYLRLKVGFSGCSLDHPLRLFAGKPFAETVPPQTWAILAHDSRDELCDAYFERIVRFDLGPLKAALQEQYGSTGPFNLKFVDSTGLIHTLLVP